MYPVDIQTGFPNPMPSDQRAGHAQLHRDINAVVIALQAKLGIDASADITSIDFLVKSALNPGHTHTKTVVGLGNVVNALQLVASNNLSDLTNTDAALTNLGILYTKAGLASQADAEAGSENTKLMTPLRVKQAITVFATPIASDAEAIAGVSTTKAINPKQSKDLRQDMIDTSSARSAGVNYQATVAGMVVAYCTKGSDNFYDMNAYVGASSPATIKIAASAQVSTGSAVTGNLMFPVAKNQWYRVDFSATGFAPGSITIVFIPFK